jgi:hypothetical protein
MGLIDKLQNNGSPLSIANGGQVDTNPLATNQSKLHIYSLDGTGAQLINSQYQQYVDGVNNPLPMPSQLDLNGVTPSKYIDNLPG